MKFLLLLLLVTGCSVTRFYQGPSVAEELKKNEQGLSLVIAKVEDDFRQKQEFVGRFEKTGNDPFIQDSLATMLQELEVRKNVLSSRADQILSRNGDLIEEIGDKKKIGENDPVFERLEEFARTKDQSLQEIMNELFAYRKAAQEFEKIAFFTKLVKR